jgi:hypothetical protein
MRVLFQWAGYSSMMHVYIWIEVEYKEHRRGSKGKRREVENGERTEEGSRGTEGNNLERKVSPGTTALQR